MKKYLFLILIILIVIVFLLLLPSSKVHAKDQEKEVRIRPVAFSVYYVKATNPRPPIFWLEGYIKEERKIKFVDSMCMVDEGCNNMVYNDKRYPKCVKSCTHYETNWKEVKYLNAEKKPIDSKVYKVLGYKREK